MAAGTNASGQTGIVPGDSEVRNSSFQHRMLLIHVEKDKSMPSDVLHMLAMILLAGIAASILGGSILPFSVTVAVVWAGWHVACGLYG